MKEPKESKMKELMKVTRPVSDWLQKNYGAYNKIIISYDKVELVNEEMSFPIDVPD